MRTRSVLMILVLGLAMVVMASPTKVDASVAGEYPEFPYAATAYTEPYRGQFHFSSRGGWMNDINAPLYHNGVYHVFYQHNPHGLQWDTMHWGHATSPDLLHWTQQPIALEPGVHPGNLFSGGGVVDANNTSGLGIGAEGPIVVFTGTDGVSVAYSNDGARTFQPYDGGRQVFTMPANSRDPKVLWHAPTNRWVMVVWSDAGGNAAHIYTSPNLLDWAFRSRYAADWLFECPDLFPLQVDGSGATRWVLADAQGEYVVGDFDGTTFTTDWTAPQAMDRGDTGFTGSFYAGLTFSNMPDGRTVQMAWMPGNHTIVAQAEGRLYQTLEQSASGPIIYAFRDPFVFRNPDDDKTYILFEGNTPGVAGEYRCTSQDLGRLPPGHVVPPESRFYTGNIGLAEATSSNLRNFRLLPPVLSANCVNQQTERPHLVFREGRVFLFTISHTFTYAPGLTGPDGVYGFVGDSIRSDYKPLNGSSLVLANPEAQPWQQYSHYVMPNLLVESFIDRIPTATGELSGGTLAPTLQLAIRGNNTYVVDVLDYGYIPATRQTSSRPSNTR